MINAQHFLGMAKWLLENWENGIYFLVIAALILRFVGKPYVDYVVEDRVNQKMEIIISVLDSIDSKIQDYE